MCRCGYRPCGLTPTEPCGFIHSRKLIHHGPCHLRNFLFRAPYHHKNKSKTYEKTNPQSTITTSTTPDPPSEPWKSPRDLRRRCFLHVPAGVVRGRQLQIFLHRSRLPRRHLYPTLENQRRRKDSRIP